MLQLKTPRGLPVLVPETEAEDPSPKFDPQDKAGMRNYYLENGYVVVRGLLSTKACDHIRSLWDSEVKPYRGHIYRQATAKAETHRLNERNWVMNPILNLQSVDPTLFPQFRSFATSEILASPALAEAFSSLFDEAPKIVQSMYFEGNSATWEHQDTYYLDSVEVGSMCAAWLALEAIDAQAGRFFICPGSHLITLEEHGIHNNIAENHETYIQSVVAKIRESGLDIRAPRLEKGDTLLWNAKTIHGSLNSQSLSHARSSITCHAIPASHDFLQLQTRRMSLPTKAVNGIQIYCPKDQAHLVNRLVLAMESNFPAAFYALKRAAVKYVLSHKKTNELAT